MTNRALEVKTFAMHNGVENACKEFNLKESTVKTYIQKAKEDKEVSTDVEVLAKKLASTFSPREIKAITEGISLKTFEKKEKTYDFDGEEVIIGVMSDLHLGSKYTNPQVIYDAFEVFAKNNVNLLCLCGDITEGFSNRPGHVFELSHVGYTQQKKHAVEVLSQWKQSDMLMIDGNHDRWYVKSCGAYIVQDICTEIDNATFLGCDEGDVSLSNNVTVRMWHGEDASSYSHSYRLQKIVESFTGGEKPNVLLTGHVHKSIYCFDRNIHCISAGAMQSQSKWMRSKRIPSHTGFWILRIVINKKGVASFSPTWYPFYI